MTLALMQICHFVWCTISIAYGPIDTVKHMKIALKDIFFCTKMLILLIFGHQLFPLFG